MPAKKKSPLMTADPYHTPGYVRIGGIRNGDEALGGGELDRVDQLMLTLALGPLMSRGKFNNVTRASPLTQIRCR